MKRLSLLCGMIAALCLFSSPDSRAQTASNGPLIGQVVDGNYQYKLLGPTQSSPWLILQTGLTGSANQVPNIIYSGKNPFKPKPSETLIKKLGTPNTKTLISQWVSGIVANGKDALTAQFNAYYKKNGAPEYTGLSAEAFRAQGVDPEAPPKDNW